jgi:hypothetical protein
MSDEIVDFSEVPTSSGVPPILPFVAVVGIVGIFAIGTAVVLTAGWGHVWPSVQALRIALGGQP